MLSRSIGLESCAIPGESLTPRTQGAPTPVTIFLKSTQPSVLMRHIHDPLPTLLTYSASFSSQPDLVSGCPRMLLHAAEVCGWMGGCLCLSPSNPVQAPSIHPRVQHLLKLGRRVPKTREGQLCGAGSLWAYQEPLKRKAGILDHLLSEG